MTLRCFGLVTFATCQLSISVHAGVQFRHMSTLVYLLKVMYNISTL